MISVELKIQDSDLGLQGSGMSRGEKDGNREYCCDK